MVDSTVLQAYQLLTCPSCSLMSLGSSREWLVFKTSSSKLLYIITASTRTPTKVTKSYSYANLTTLVSVLNDESIATEIYTIISDKLQLPDKPEPPFIYLGLINDYSGVDVNQCKEYIKINASNYID